jgi:hypothetical protein
MPDPGLLSAKVRAYMEALSPQARAMVLRAARLSVARGDGDVPADVLLRASEGLDVDDAGLERAITSATPFAPRPVGAPAPARPAAPTTTAAPPSSAVGAAPIAGPVAVPPPEPPSLAWRDRVDQRFWAALDPFLVEHPGPVKQTGRIARHSAERIGIWLMRDVAGAEFAAAYAEDPRDPNADPTRCVERLRHGVVTRALSVVREAEDDPKTWQRFVAHLGGERVVADLRDLIQIFQRDAVLTAFGEQLPRVITVLDLDDVGAVQNAVRAFAKAEGTDLAFAAAMMLARTAQPHLLALAAVRLAGNVDARGVAASPFGRFVEFLVAELERRVAIARQYEADRTNRDRFLTALRDYHDIHRQTLIVLALDDVPQWHRRVGALRKDLSTLVGRYLEAAPGLVRRALRVESLAGAFGGGFDRDAFEDAEFSVQIHVEARAAAESLAVNEMLTRTRRELERTLELLTDRLFAEIKGAQVFDRDALAAATDGAIRLCRLVFGEDYAALLRKNRDIGLARPAQRAAG